MEGKITLCFPKKKIIELINLPEGYKATVVGEESRINSTDELTEVKLNFRIFIKPAIPTSNE